MEIIAYFYGGSSNSSLMKLLHIGRVDCEIILARKPQTLKGVFHVRHVPVPRTMREGEGEGKRGRERERKMERERETEMEGGKGYGKYIRRSINYLTNIDCLHIA